MIYPLSQFAMNRVLPQKSFATYPRDGSPRSSRAFCDNPGN